MKILFVCNKSPWPAKEGGPIAMNALISGLLDAGHSVKILAVNSDKYSVDIDNIPAPYKQKTVIEFVNLQLKINPWHAFLNYFSKKSLHVQRFITTEFKSKITRILKEEDFDIVQFETLYVSPYIELIRSISSAKIVLRAHNVEHLIWERITNKTKNPIKKRYLRHITDTLRNYELESMNSFDGVAAITKIDAELFLKLGCKVPIGVFPFGIDTEIFSKIGTIKPNSKTFFHLGSMDWLPNIEGIKWFIKEIWSSVIEKHPDAKFLLAGRNMPESILNLKVKGIEVVGEVPDAYKFMLSSGVMIVPLLSGSGIRIKIIEGMACGVPIISTSIGAEGIEITSGKDIFIADSKNDFLESISECINNKQLTKSVGEKAKQTIFKNHDNQQIIDNLLRFYKKLM